MAAISSTGIERTVVTEQRLAHLPSELLVSQAPPLPRVDLRRGTDVVGPATLASRCLCPEGLVVIARSSDTPNHRVRRRAPSATVGILHRRSRRPSSPPSPSTSFLLELQFVRKLGAETQRAAHPALGNSHLARLGCEGSPSGAPRGTGWWQTIAAAPSSSPSARGTGSRDSCSRSMAFASTAPVARPSLGLHGSVRSRVGGAPSGLGFQCTKA